MKVRLKKTGEIIEVNEYEYNLVSVNKYNEAGYPIIYGLDEVELIPDTSQDK